MRTSQFHSIVGNDWGPSYVPDPAVPADGPKESQLDEKWWGS